MTNPDPKFSAWLARTQEMADRDRTELLAPRLRKPFPFPHARELGDFVEWTSEFRDMICTRISMALAEQLSYGSKDGVNPKAWLVRGLDGWWDYEYMPVPGSYTTSNDPPGPITMRRVSSLVMASYLEGQYTRDLPTLKAFIAWNHVVSYAAEAGASIFGFRFETQADGRVAVLEDNDDVQ